MPAFLSLSLKLNSALLIKHFKKLNKEFKD